MATEKFDHFIGSSRKAMESKSSTEDSLLVREAQAGNHAAFDRLV